MRRPSSRRRSTGCWTAASWRTRRPMRTPCAENSRTHSQPQRTHRQGRRLARSNVKMADNGLTTIASHHAVKDTIDRLEAEVKPKSMTVFARIDHAEGARGGGRVPRPTEVLIYGNARAVTPLI